MVKNQVVESGISFEDFGTLRLKSVPDGWCLYPVLNIHCDVWRIEGRRSRVRNYNSSRREIYALWSAKTLRQSSSTVQGLYSW